MSFAARPHPSKIWAKTNYRCSEIFALRRNSNLLFLSNGMISYYDIHVVCAFENQYKVSYIRELHMHKDIGQNILLAKYAIIRCISEKYFILILRL